MDEKSKEKGSIKIEKGLEGLKSLRASQPNGIEYSGKISPVIKSKRSSRVIKTVFEDPPKTPCQDDKSERVFLGNEPLRNDSQDLQKYIPPEKLDSSIDKIIRENTENLSENSDYTRWLYNSKQRNSQSVGPSTEVNLVSPQKTTRSGMVPKLDFSRLEPHKQFPNQPNPADPKNNIVSFDGIEKSVSIHNPPPAVSKRPSKDPTNLVLILLILSLLVGVFDILTLQGALPGLGWLFSELAKFTIDSSPGLAMFLILLTVLGQEILVFLPGRSSYLALLSHKIGGFGAALTLMGFLLAGIHLIMHFGFKRCCSCFRKLRFLEREAVQEAENSSNPSNCSNQEDTKKEEASKKGFQGSDKSRPKKRLAKEILNGFIFCWLSIHESIIIFFFDEANLMKILCKEIFRLAPVCLVTFLTKNLSSFVAKDDKLNQQSVPLSVTIFTVYEYLRLLSTTILVIFWLIHHRKLQFFNFRGRKVHPKPNSKAITLPDKSLNTKTLDNDKNNDSAAVAIVS